MRCALGAAWPGAAGPRGGASCDSPIDVEHQRRGLIARIVGAMTEEHARATQASFHAGDQFACGLSAPWPFLV